jgi:hypothetical protein
MMGRVVATRMPMSRLFLIFVLLSGLLAGCREPGPGSVSGQIKAITPEGGVQNVAGAQVILRGARDTYTTVTTAGETSGDEADASYNYRFEKVPAGTYTMAVTPPPGAGLQPEDNVTLDVKADEQFPQSVLLLREGVAKPRPLTPSELNAGEVGYINDRGERVVHQQGGGIDTTDLLLMYLLFRNPPAFGYGAPPVLVGGPGTSTSGPRYRVEDPPRTTQTGQRVTQRPPSVPGQGATRPGSAPASGPGPNTGPASSNGSGPTNVSPKTTSPNGVAAPASKNGTSPNGSSDVRAPSSAPSQGVSRPSSAPSRPSAPVRAPSGRSGGGRR